MILKSMLLRMMFASGVSLPKGGNQPFFPER
jgi:hypothetical protein